MAAWQVASEAQVPQKNPLPFALSRPGRSGYLFISGRVIQNSGNENYYFSLYFFHKVD
jgi:hypothetical protein